jgi:hypothetical protein
MGPSPRPASSPITPGPMNIQNKKPQNTKRIPTSQSVRLGLFRGRLVIGFFLYLLYRRSLVSSSQVAEGGFFAFNSIHIPSGAVPHHGGRLFCFGLSEIPNAHDRRFYNATTITRPASRSEDGCNGSHDHVTAAADKVAPLPITGVQELQKLPVFDFFPLLFFLFCGANFFCPGLIDHGMVTGGFQR